MSEKKAKLSGFVIWLSRNGQLDEAFRLLREPGGEAEAKLEKLYAPYRDSFGEDEAPTFKDALFQLAEVLNRLTAPTDANVTASDRDADSDGDEGEEAEMNAGAKALVKENILMLIDSHNDVVKALRSGDVRFDAKGTQWVLSVLLKLMNVGALLSGMARKYGLSAECVHGAGNILVDWEDAYKDARLVRLIIEGGGLDYESFDPEELAEALTAAESDSESD